MIKLPWSAYCPHCWIRRLENVWGTPAPSEWPNNSAGMRWCSGEWPTPARRLASNRQRRADDSRRYIRTRPGGDERALLRDEDRRRQPCRFLEGKGKGG